MGAKRKSWWRRLWAWIRRRLVPAPMEAPDRAATTLGPPGDRRRKEWVRRYFRKAPHHYDLTIAVRWLVAGWVLLGVAVLLAAAMLLGLPWGWPLGTGAVALVLLVIGFVGWREYHHSFADAEAKPTGAMLDRTLDADLRRAAADALALFHLDADDLHPEGRPLVFVAPTDKARHREDYRDRLHRFTAYRVSVVCVAERHLAVLTFELDLVAGSRKEVDTHQLHHDYIAALHTATRPALGLTAQAVAGFASRRRKPFVLQELEITATDDTAVGIPTEISQPRPAELHTAVTLAEALPFLSEVLVGKPGWVRTRLEDDRTEPGPPEPKIPEPRPDPDLHLVPDAAGPDSEPAV